MNPTEQQAEIQKAFDEELNLVVEALAGTGKTSTILYCAEETDRRGIIITYNKDAQRDVEGKLKKAGINGRVTARTGHSLAFGHAIKSRVFGNQPRVPGWKAAQILGISETVRVGEDGEADLGPADLARLAQATVKRWCHTADEKIERYHVPGVPGAEAQREEVRDIVHGYAIKVWADAQNDRGQLRYDHDWYLKSWALSQPTLRVQFLFLDEAQDTNPVLAKVVNDQNCQKIMVGDRFQAIYGWRGATDAMANFACDRRLALTQSFRFGQAVADEANKLLELLGSDIRLEGNPAIDSVVDAVESPKAILCRTNATCVGEALEALKAGKKVALAGGKKKVGPLVTFIEGAEELMDGGKTKHPELVAFRSWEEVVQHSKDEDGADLRVWVRLIDLYGTTALREACNQMGNEEGADLVLSTAHSAKGREWETVRIASDFKAPQDDAPLGRPEAMLLYVGLTRARNVLDRTNVSWVDQLTAVAA